jgi:hypothetical protein
MVEVTLTGLLCCIKIDAVDKEIPPAGLRATEYEPPPV